ncbi:MAG: hypothetical protein RL266_2618, partial [Bacteroidota bacterium]
MIKKLLVATIASIAFHVHSHAQITIESTDLTSIGDEILRYIDT